MNHLYYCDIPFKIRIYNFEFMVILKQCNSLLSITDGWWRSLQCYCDMTKTALTKTLLQLEPGKHHSTAYGKSSTSPLLEFWELWWKLLCLKYAVKKDKMWLKRLQKSKTSVFIPTQSQPSAKIKQDSHFITTIETSLWVVSILGLSITLPNRLPSLLPSKHSAVKVRT